MNSKISILLIPLVLGWFGLLPKAQAVVPPPDGGYPGFNTAEGDHALFSLSTGVGNTAAGWYALSSNTLGELNTAVGAGTLVSNIGNPPALEGVRNTAIGAVALLTNATGSFNTAVGATALLFNTTGGANTAVGEGALYSNDTGLFNTATGTEALATNTAGSRNVASGFSALFGNTSGGQNTAIGFGALEDNTTGARNTASGAFALASNTTGSDNIALGHSAGGAVTTASNVICIGSSGGDVSDTTWIGNVFGKTTQSGQTAPVIVSNSGQLGTMASSKRFKKDIAAMDRASEDILSLRPVTFHYKSDAESTPQFGLIAEEVAKINPALVLPDKQGKPYTVRYEQVNAMLLNEFLKEHKRVETQQATITELKSIVTRQQMVVDSVVARVEEQAGEIRKVKVQMEMNKPASQIVINP